MSEPHRESPLPTQAAPRHSAPAGTRQGKTLADIAGSTPGKSDEGLVTAMVPAAKANLDALGGRPRWGFGGRARADRPQPATPSGGTTL